MFLQEIFVVQDFHYYNDGSSVTGLEIGSGVSCTSNNSYITITTNASGERDVKLPTNLNGNWEFETELAELGTAQYLTFKVGSGQQWGALSTDGKLTVNLGSSHYYNVNVSKGDVLKITYINGTMSVYYNNDLKESKAVTINGKMGYYTFSGRIQHIKNIKLKAL